MTNVEQHVEDDKLKHGMWDAFKALPGLNMMWGATIQSVWYDDCLYVVRANIMQRYMLVQLVFHEEDYGEGDFKEKMMYLLQDMQKHFKQYGVMLNIPTEWAGTDPKANDFSFELIND